MDFDSFMAQAWDDHAADAKGVAQRLSEHGIALLTTESQLVQLMNLTHHVCGEHLQDWAQGEASFLALRSNPFYLDSGDSGGMARRCVASLSLSANADLSLEALTVSDQIRVQAMSAANLSSSHPQRAMQLLQAALGQAARSELTTTDPMHRALAVSSHNLAASLEEKSELSFEETQLMLTAAQASRTHWERAGTWLQVERAEYQLATAFLKAGDLKQAEIHALECSRIVTANEAPALEQFFAAEALARVMRAAKNEAAFKAATEHARTAFAGLADDDKAWCEAPLKKLASY